MEAQAVLELVWRGARVRVELQATIEPAPGLARVEARVLLDCGSDVIGKGITRGGFRDAPLLQDPSLRADQILRMGELIGVPTARAAAGLDELPRLPADELQQRQPQA